MAERAVQSVGRAVDILEAVGAAGEVGVTELARSLGLHVATVHNLLRTLTGRHYLLNVSGRYRLGPAVALLAARWDPLHSLPELVQPYLRQVAERCGEAASATVLLGFEARLVAFQPGTEAITIHFPQWVWPQALKLATGRLLVALGDQARWDGFIAHSPEVCPAWDAARWRAELARLRSLGYCALRTDRDGGQALFALPLRLGDGQAVASIGASCPAFRANGDRFAAMVAAVGAAAASLSAALGGPPPIAPTIEFDALPLDHQADEPTPATQEGADA